MARRIPHSVGYPQSVTSVHAALTDERYWRERIAEVGGDNARLDTLEIGDGTVSVEMEQAIPAEHLPSMVTKIRPGDLQIVRTESWGPLVGERATGAVTARVTGMPGELTGTVTLSASGTGSIVELDGEVLVPLPLIGGRIEAVIAERITEIFNHEDEFTARWLSSRG
ncbi:DUF2505 domain-containing protein [Rhodococcus gannanensis]|uniref:DUF2505 domain-containing protein n=1 Tax=Rhodococcus gannanensis TaxID=1960308 RepID=A0ABW4PCH5_9NOCA